MTFPGSFKCNCGYIAFAENLDTHPRAKGIQTQAQLCIQWAI